MFRGYDAKFKFDLLFTNIDRDDNCIVLNTDLGSKTKVRVWVNAKVSSVDDKSSLSFSGFNLGYKTPDGENVAAVRYKTNI
ncbi:hypothetical protein [Enterocloster citroniae]|uniref:hypothetical protein n=1 Tax=Enterocloster citroniae TaxID=358743 RepID=UPI00349E4ED0